MAPCYVKANQTQTQASDQNGPRSFAPSQPVLLLSLLLFGVGGLTSCGNKPSADADSAAPRPPSTNAPTAAAATKPEYAKLVGKWERPDGGYILEIKSIDAVGVIEAGYFNPDPIRVSKAVAFKDQGATKVFIELNDVNYPGCTYSLAYDPQTDQLVGQYYQAAMRETFDITFVRVK